MKADHAARASAPPTQIRRTPSAARSRHREAEIAEHSTLTGVRHRGDDGGDVVARRDARREEHVGAGLGEGVSRRHDRRAARGGPRSGHSARPVSRTTGRRGSIARRAAARAPRRPKRRAVAGRPVTSSIESPATPVATRASRWRRRLPAWTQAGLEIRVDRQIGSADDLGDVRQHRLDRHAIRPAGRQANPASVVASALKPNRAAAGRAGSQGFGITKQPAR